MNKVRNLFPYLPLWLQRTVMREYMVREICHGRRVAEGEILRLPDFVKPGDTVWDIGANAGEYTYQLARLVGEHGRVLAFEPMDYNFGTLRTTIRRAGFGNVAAHQLAISDYEGSACMNMPSILGHSLASFSPTGQQVEVRTIDGLLGSGFPRPSFIKCDVEGNAPQVVAGARELIRDFAPVWLMEVWNDEEIADMRRLGYRCFRYPVRGGSLYEVDRREGTTSTYFFVPERKFQFAGKELP